MKNLSEMMKKAQEMQDRMQSVQAELDQLEVVGEAGGGMVKMTMTAKGALKAVVIDPSLFEAGEKDVLEDLLIAAHTSAKARGEAAAAEKMKDIAGGLSLPGGFKMPF